MSKMLTIHGEIIQDRFYVPRKNGGRGLTQIKGAYILDWRNMWNVKRIRWCRLLDSTNVTQIQHCFKRLPTSRNLF
jgi:hypothetical protein